MLGGLKSIFGGGGEKGESPQTTLKELQKRVKIAQKVFADPSQTEFIPITIPTLMSIWETDRLITALNEFNIACNTIIINQINPENDACQFCTQRNKQQSKLIVEFKDLHEDYEIKELEMFSYELRGLDILKQLTSIWTS